MPGYLDQYGAGDERRERRNKLIAIVGASVLVLLFFWFIFFVWDKTEILRIESVARLAQILRNHRQENRVRNFFSLVEHHDYKGAYALWNCTEANPCRDYSFNEFMKDWGPGGVQGAGPFSVVKSRSCGSGVIVTVDSPQNQEQALWVERGNLTIGFSPFPVCQAGT